MPKKKTITITPTRQHNLKEVKNMLKPTPIFTEKPTGTKIEISTIENFPLSNLNRDKAGSPKRFKFGDTMRAMYSSQCLKRAIREALAEVYESAGVRTRMAPKLVRDSLIEKGLDEDLANLAKNLVALHFGKNADDEDATNQVIAYNESELEIMADCLYDALKDETISSAKEKYIIEEKKKKGSKETEAKESSECKNLFTAISKKVKDAPNALGLALSGRMDATKTFGNIEAACSAAFSFGTNPQVTTNDFFIALDDINDNGAGMMGDTELTSDCFFRHVVLDVDQLKKNLEGYEGVDEFVRKFVPAFIDKAATVVPSAKKHGTDTNQLPAAVLVEIKDRQCSHANAFITPVKSGDLIKESVKRLAEHCQRMQDAWGFDCRKRVWFTSLSDKDELAIDCATNVSDFKELLNEFADIDSI